MLHFNLSLCLRIPVPTDYIWLTTHSLHGPRYEHQPLYYCFISMIASGVFLSFKLRVVLIPLKYISSKVFFVVRKKPSLSAQQPVIAYALLLSNSAISFFLVRKKSNL